MALGNLLLIALVCRQTFALDTGESSFHQKRFFHSRSHPSHYSSLSSYEVGHPSLTIDEHPWKLNSLAFGHKPIIKDVNPWELSSSGIGHQSLESAVLPGKPGPFGLGYQSLAVDANPWKPIIKSSPPLGQPTGFTSVVKDLTSWPEKQTIEPIKKVPLESLPLQQATPLAVPAHPIEPCPVPIEKPQVLPPIENQIVHQPVALPHPQPLPVPLPIISHFQQALPHPLLSPHPGVQGLLPQGLQVLHGLPQLLPLPPNLIPAQSLLGYPLSGLAAHGSLRLPLNLISNQGLLSLPPPQNFPAHGLLGLSHNPLLTHPLPLTAATVQGPLLHSPALGLPNQGLLGLPPPPSSLPAHGLLGLSSNSLLAHPLPLPVPAVQGPLLHGPAPGLIGHNLVSGLYPGARVQGTHLHAKRSKDKDDEEDNDGKNT